jgi:hypothetical protein
LVELLHGEIPPKDPLGAHMYGYYNATFGIPYHHFEVDSLFAGRFRGQKVTVGSIAALTAGALPTVLGRVPRRLLRSISLARTLRSAPAPP